MNAATVGAWLGQRSTGLGIVAIVSTLAGILSHQITWQEAIMPLCGAIAALLVPENAHGPVIIDGVATANVVDIKTAAGATTTIR